FDSGGKEALFLHEQGVPFEVVPGIPVAVGGPAYAGIPVTYPEAGNVLTIIRGHENESDTAPDVDWTGLAGSAGTIVCYAGARQIRAMSRALISHGRPADETAALIYDATLPSQRSPPMPFASPRPRIPVHSTRRAGTRDRSTGSCSPARTRWITSCGGFSTSAMFVICMACASVPSGRPPPRDCSVTAFAST